MRQPLRCGLPYLLSLSERCLLGLFALVSSTACGGGEPRVQQPEATVSHDPEAQGAFKTLSAAWHAASPEQRVGLEAAYRDFLRRYPEPNGQTRLASAYLAWILVQKGEQVEANRLSLQAARGPRGAARDFGRVVEAALLIELGRPQQALKILRQVQGKIIDPVERFLATEQLVKAAAAAKLYTESLLYMVDWVDQAHVRERERVRRSASERISTIPRQGLEQSIAHIEPLEEDPDLKDNPHRYSVKQWVFDGVTQRLSHLALQRSDQALAEKLLKMNPRVTALGAEAEALVRLASGGALAANVSGRTVGLLLSTGKDRDRIRSRQLMTGVSFALGLPNAAELSGTTKLKLAAHDGGEADQALAELLSEGASLLIAGVTSEDSQAAIDFARQRQLPLLLISPGSQSGSHAFHLGASPTKEYNLLVSESGNDATLWDTATAPLQTSAGCPAFPINKARRFSHLLLRTTASCAAELQDSLAPLARKPWLGFNLEAASSSNPNLRRTSIVSAGYYPFLDSWVTTAERVPGTVRERVTAFERDFGHRPMWYEALGYDAARFADHALVSVPELVTDDAEKVVQFHKKLKTALEVANLQGLWTTTNGRFREDNQLERTLKLRRSSP